MRKKAAPKSTPFPKELLVYQDKSDNEIYYIAAEHKAELPENVTRVGVYCWTETREVINTRELI